MRDDFSISTKESLARRVGYRCANPGCRQLTIGPKEKLATLNIGVAAHITAAAPGGKRYDATISSKERAASHNGIWLCQNCAKMIDDDEKHFTVGVIYEWRRLSEQATRMELETPKHQISAFSDVDIIKFYAQCFDRPAFQDQFNQEVSYQAFDKAIEDTITAISTGTLQSRDGTILSQAKGRAFIQNREWRENINDIYDLLRSIRTRYTLAIRMGQITISNGHHYMKDRVLGQFFDNDRDKVHELFADLCKKAGLPSINSRRQRNNDW